MSATLKQLAQRAENLAISSRSVATELSNLSWVPEAYDEQSQISLLAKLTQLEGSVVDLKKSLAEAAP